MNICSKPQEWGTLIRPKYADDIGWGAANCRHRVDAERKETIPKLVARGLRINEAKTEEFTIQENGPEQWKKCKILGSLLDTTEDKETKKTTCQQCNAKTQTHLRKTTDSKKD